MASVAKRKWTYQGAQREAWVVRYKDKGGAHRSKQFERKKEADAYCRKVENELEAGLHVPRTESITVSAAIKEYTAFIHQRRQNGQVSESYVARTRTCSLYIEEHLGSVLFVDLRWQDVEKMGLALRQGRCRRRNSPISVNTVKGILNTFNTIAGYAVRRGYVSRNVVRDAMIELGRMHSPVTPKFTKDEVRRLVEALEDRKRYTSRRSVAYLRAMVYCAAFCGLRKGEISALTWDAIDFDRAVIRVDQSLTELDELKGTKTASGVRRVPLPTVVARAIEAWRPFAVTDDRGLIFRSAKGGVGKRLASPGWYSALERAGMPRGPRGYRRFHELRHFAGSAWLEAGIPLPEVSRLLGHAHTGITAQIYSHAIVDTEHRAEALFACAANVTETVCLPPPITQVVRKAA